MWGDRRNMQQVLINLVLNALEFSLAGVASISRASHELAESFGTFVQVDPKVTRLPDGVGLGLATSRDLTAGKGGDLVAKSQEGAGSSITFTLPARAPADVNRLLSW